MEDRQKIFERVKKKAQEDYKKIDNVYNPFLQCNINFNAKGLDHIKFKEWNKT